MNKSYSSGPLHNPPFITEYNFSVQVLPLNEVLKLELDNNRSIKAGSYVTRPHGEQYDFIWNAAESLNHMHNYTLKWLNVEPRFKL